MRMLRHVEKALYEGAERIVTVTEPMRVRLTDRGVQPEKIGVVPNGADLERLMPRIGSAALAATDLADEVGKHWRGLGGSDDEGLHAAWRSLVDTHNLPSEWWVPRHGLVEDPVHVRGLTSGR